MNFSFDFGSLFFCVRQNLCKQTVFLWREGTRWEMLSNNKCHNKRAFQFLVNQTSHDEEKNVSIKVMSLIFQLENVWFANCDKLLDDRVRYSNKYIADAASPKIEKEKVSASFVFLRSANAYISPWIIKFNWKCVNIFMMVWMKNIIYLYLVIYKISFSAVRFAIRALYESERQQKM